MTRILFKFTNFFSDFIKLSKKPIYLDVHAVSSDIYIIIASTARSLALAFVRAQEFYESPNKTFRGHYFTMQDYIDWWSSECGKGDFTYIDKWRGFNIPGNVLASWETLFRKNEPKLRQLEESILKLFHSILQQNRMRANQVYIIGLTETSFKNHDDAYLHELSHALFTLDVDFKEKAIKLIQTVPKQEQIEKLISKCDYSDLVLDDEIIAYQTTNNKVFKELLLDALSKRNITP